MDQKCFYFLLYYITFLDLLLMTDEANVDINKCIYNDSGMFWFFGTERLNVKNKLDKVLLRFSNFSITKFDTTCAKNKTDLYACRFLTQYEASNSLDDNKETETKRIFLLGKFFNSTDVNVLKNFTFNFDRCHLKNCDNVISKAYLESVVMTNDKFVITLKGHNVVSQDQHYSTTIKNVDSNLLKTISVDAPFEINDLCATYEICAITKWGYCNDSVNMSSQYRDCESKTINSGEISTLSCGIDKTQNGSYKIQIDISPEHEENLFNITIADIVIAENTKHLMLPINSSIFKRISVDNLSGKVHASRRGCYKESKCQYNPSTHSSNVLLYVICGIGVLFTILFIIFGYFHCSRFLMHYNCTSQLDEEYIDDDISIVMPLSQSDSYTEIPEKAHHYIDANKTFGDVVELDDYGNSNLNDKNDI